MFATLQRHVDVEADSAIMRDLSRTFPHHVHFMYRQGQGQRSLYNVLRAYSAYDRKVHAKHPPLCIPCALCNSLLVLPVGSMNLELWHSALLLKCQQ